MVYSESMTLEIVLIWEISSHGSEFVIAFFNWSKKY